MKNFFRHIICIVAAAWGVSLFGVPLIEGQKPPTKLEQEQQKKREQERAGLPTLPARIGGGAQSGTQAGASAGAVAKPAPSGKLQKMQFYADEEFNIEGTDTVVLLKNVVLHHNGAVVVCDSAVRYSQSRFDCFGKVILNQDSTYVYCDKASYDRDLNTAQLFSPMIKVVSGSSTLYTYNMSFNTLDRVGRYWGGGTMLQDSNRMESDRGWYHSQTRDIYAVGQVQLTDPDYQMIGDSVRYNTGEQVAEFYTGAHIWNKSGEQVSGVRGLYFHKTQQIDITQRGYVLSGTKELWADSLLYNSKTEDAVARRNVQMRDDEQQSMAFGDYGEWHGAREEGFLTREPSVAAFDKDNVADTLYMRADSIWFQSAPWDSVLVAVETAVSDSMASADMEGEMLGMPPKPNHPIRVNDPATADFVSVADSVGLRDTLAMQLPDSVVVSDSIAVLLPDSLGGRDSLVAVPVVDTIKHDSLQRIVRAFRDVKIWRRDFQAVCDSLVGFSKDSTAHMYVDPVLWNEMNQITSDRVDIYTKNKELDSARFVGRPLMVALVEGQDYNQIKGREMTSKFRHNDIWKHFVDGNVQTLYYMVEEGQTMPHTFMSVNAVSATFIIDSQRIEKILYAGNPDWEGHPIDKIPKDMPQRLDGFRWEAERRPSREDVFTRTVKPSQREEYMAMPRPEFPLTRRIEEHKRQMIGARQWEERYELLPQKATEWLSTIVTK